MFELSENEVVAILWECTLNLVVHQLNFTVMKTYSFENLDVWQCSRKFAVAIYSTTKSYPDEEKFGLVSQMRRAAISISSNLAEGSAKHTGKKRQDLPKQHLAA